jgi:adenine-specific DNA-methyltransferase
LNFKGAWGRDWKNRTWPRAISLRRPEVEYANQREHPVGVLISFAQLYIIDCRYQANIETSISCVVKKYEYTDFVDPDKWAEIFFLLSRPAINAGAIGKFAEMLPKLKPRRGQKSFFPRAYKPLDERLLETLDSLRERLARTLKSHNNSLDSHQLTELTQRILDRLVFIRFLEDKLIEPSSVIPKLGQSGRTAWHDFLSESRRLDGIYNGIVFKHHTLLDDPEGLEIDDRAFADILDDFDYHKSSYLFNDIPLHILGSIYEQFLGNVIVATDKRAKLEPKPEVRKAGGVYYTPKYVVDYIVENTVGRLIAGKTPNEIAKMRFADIACGSGSFLLGIYDYVLKYITRWYNDHPSKAPAAAVVKAQGVLHLSLKEKTRILLDNIYGVDIDPQAVEVAQLSLYLKLLEEETTASARQYTLSFHQPLLPSLSNNIKCGNSLIGPDLYTGVQQSFFDDEEQSRINVFDWHAKDGFPEILKSGGFDAVIGNPPWGATFSEFELAYLRARQRQVIARMIDSYIYFTNQSIAIARRNGMVAFIVPSTILNQTDARPVRALLLDRGLATLVNLGQGVFGSKVLNTSTIFVSVTQTAKETMRLNDVSHKPLSERAGAIHEGSTVEWNSWSNEVRRDPHLTFFVKSFDESAVLNRLRGQGPSLSEIVEGTIQRGVSPDVVAAHVVTPTEARRSRLEKEILRPSISGAQIKRYKPWNVDQYIIYTSRDTPIEDYPNALKYLRQFRPKNTCKEVVQDKHPWWALHRPRNPDIFSSPKFIGLTTTKSIELIYDEQANVYVTDAMYVFSLREGIDPWACMAVLQSNTFLFLYRISNQGESRVIPQIKASKLETLPLPPKSEIVDAAVTLRTRVEAMLELNTKLPDAKTDHARMVIQRQLEATDRQINQLVYQLYGLTASEIAMVEAAIA